VGGGGIEVGSADSGSVGDASLPPSARSLLALSLAVAVAAVWMLLED